MSPEITRRVVWIRLRPSVENPSEMEFRIKDLRKWALEHRSDLVTACLTLIRKWVALGIPDGQARKGSYESWASIMSGILDAVGVEGFLGNYARLSEKANESSEIWREFVRAWNMKHSTSPVGVSELFLLASTKTTTINGQKDEIGQNYLGDLLTQETERGRKVKLGELLKSQVDRVYGSYRIVKAGTSKRLAQYQLESIGVPGVSQDEGTPQGTPHTKTCNNQPSSVHSVPSVPLYAYRGEGEGGIYPPPGESSRVETGTPDTPKRYKPVSQQAGNLFDSNGVSQKSDTPDTPQKTSEPEIEYETGVI